MTDKEQIEYPFPGETTILFSNAKSFIADVVLSPGEDRNTVRKRVGERIKYAEAKGLIPRSRPLRNDRVLDAPQLFLWAKGKKGWEALREVKGLPVAPVNWRGEVDGNSK